MPMPKRKPNYNGTTMQELLSAVFEFYGDLVDDRSEKDTDHAYGHTPVSLAGILPANGKPGLTTGTKCAVCDEILLEQKEINSVTTLILPTQLHRIGDSAFAGTATQYVLIPEGVKEIGSRAFLEHRIFPSFTFLLL